MPSNKKFIKSTVKKNLKLNSKFHQILLETQDKKFKFQPGQYVVLKINNSTYRAYSIASSPSRLPLWEIILDVTPGGPGSTYLKNLKVGDIVQTFQPMGELYLRDDKSKNLIFIATGCGVASLKSMIDFLVKEHAPKNIYLLWGLRYKKDICLMKEIKNWNLYPRFTYDITLSKPNKNYKGKRGHVDTHLKEIVKNFDLAKTSFYLCGSEEMIGDFQKNLKD